MSLLSRLFGTGKPRAPERAAVDYNGYQITPEPMPADGQYRLAARIVLEQDGTRRQHHMIRADVFRDREAAEEAALNKARQLIDQQGPRLFD